MLRDITIGQYYPSDSLIHRLDPRVKLASTMLFLISLFITGSIAAYIFAGLVLLLVIRISGIPVKFIVKGLKAVFILLLISVSFNLFLTPGEVIFKLGFLHITREGVRIAVFMAVRLIYLIIGSSLMTLTTTPNELTDGLEKSLGFLNKAHIPVHEIAMMMSIALRFIPILIEETDKIMKAQMARGADFDTGGLMDRAKAMVPLLVPLFLSAFRRAADLAQAMEARCYHGGEGRTKLKPLRYKRRDYIAYLTVAIYFLVMLSTRFIGI